MPQFSSQTRLLFASYGRKGGLKRSYALSGLKRTLIAKKAAKTRWSKHSHLIEQIMPSVRFNESTLSNPTFLEELLEEGSLDDWRVLYLEVTNHPFGSTAISLKKVLSSTKIYGITPLWKGILKVAQGVYP